MGCVGSHFYPPDLPRSRSFIIFSCYFLTSPYPLSSLCAASPILLQSPYLCLTVISLSLLPVISRYCRHFSLCFFSVFTVLTSCPLFLFFVLLSLFCTYLYLIFTVLFLLSSRVFLCFPRCLLIPHLHLVIIPLIFVSLLFCAFLSVFLFLTFTSSFLSWTLSHYLVPLSSLSGPCTSSLYFSTILFLLFYCLPWPRSLFSVHLTSLPCVISHPIFVFLIFYGINLIFIFLFIFIFASFLIPATSPPSFSFLSLFFLVYIWPPFPALCLLYMLYLFSCFSWSFIALIILFT